MGASASQTGLGSSKEPEPRGLGPSGAIPRAKRYDELAVLLYDHFGPKLARLGEKIRNRPPRAASSREVANYRTCAASLLDRIDYDASERINDLRRENAELREILRGFVRNRDDLHVDEPFTGPFQRLMQMAAQAVARRPE